MNKNKLKTDNVWEKIYQEGHTQKYPWDYVVSFVYNNKPKNFKNNDVKILEVGCGTGSNLWFAAREGFDTTGIDFSKKAINEAKKIFKKDSLKCDFKVGNFKKLPFKNNYFDIIIDRAALTCVDHLLAVQAISEIERVSKEKGRFLFTPYSTSNYSYERNKSDKKGFMKKIYRGGMINVGSICFYNKKRIEDILSNWKLISLTHVEKKELISKHSHAEWHVISEKK